MQDLEAQRTSRLWREKLQAFRVFPTLAGINQGALFIALCLLAD